MKNERWRLVRRLANVLLLTGTIWFVVQYFSRNLDSALAFEGQLQVGWLALATLVLLAVYVVQALTWRRILLRSGTWLSGVTAVYVYFFGLLATYIPGRVWGPMGMISSAAEKGVPPYRSATTTVFTTGLSLVAASIVAALTVLGPGQGWRWLWLLPAALTVGTVFFPQLFVKMINLVLKRLGRNPIHLILNRFDLLKIVSTYVLTWLLYGLALYFFARAINVVPGHIISLIGANAASYLAGYMAFFTPAGLGVREVVLAEALQQSEVLDQVAWLPLTSRIWLLMTQLAGFAIVALIMWQQQKKGKILPEVE